MKPNAQTPQATVQPPLAVKRLSMMGFALALVVVMLSTPSNGLGAPKRASTPCSTLKPGAPSAVPAGTPLTLSAGTQEAGCIQLRVSGAVAPEIGFAEITAGAPAAPLATVQAVNGQVTLPQGIAWSCDRLTRTFQASEAMPDGTQQTTTVSVTTPPCTKRLSVSVPAMRLHRGYPVTLALRDRWHLGGLRVEACQPAGRRRSCSSATLQGGHMATVVRLRLRSAGRVALEVRDPYERVKLRLGVRSSRPVLLATGDSEMQVLDELIASDISGGGGVRTIGDARQSTAISSPFFFNWPAHAYAQVSGDRPDVVAMFLGGNEGFRLGGAECCGPEWSKAYAVRVGSMMRAYRQNGAAVVYWFLIPTPSSEPFVRVVRAVNRGIELAASRFRQGVHVFDLRPRFSPGGRFLAGVHEADGFHLSASADVIVARMFIARLRHDGVLP